MERDYTQMQPAAQASKLSYDMGLRQYMLGIYNYMAAALGLTGLVSYFVSTSPSLMASLFNTPLMWVVLLAPLGLVLFLSFRIHKMSASTAQAIFWAYAGLIGLGLAPIFMVYTSESIARAFFCAAATFGVMSIYGYTTKRDLTAIGSFLIMGVWGILIAMVVNMFLQSSTMGYVISGLGVLIFTGLTAYDTQRIKEMYNELDSYEDAKKKSIFGALNLYMDFINLFIHLLRFIGERR